MGTKRSLMSRQAIASVTAQAPYLLDIVWLSGKRTRVEVSEYLDDPGYGRELLHSRKVA